MKDSSYSPLRLHVISKNRLYHRALKREMNVWRSNNVEADLDSVQFLTTNISYSGKNITLSRNRDWIEFISSLGSFEKGLILGGGNAKFETYLLKKGTVKTFENLDIVFKKNETERGANQFADLNFVTLEENTYDIIIAKSILHHIINLEHLLTQVNKALKKDGIFVMLEYIGESKQQWSNNKIRFINGLLKNFDLEISKGVYDNTVPFESIRSEEIPGIINQIFSETKIIEHKWDYVYSAAKLGLYHYNLQNNVVQRDKGITIYEEAIKNSEKEAIKYNLLPTIMFGAYKKNNNNFKLEVEKWDRKKTKKELELNFNNMPYSFQKKIKIKVRDYYNYLFT